MMYAGTIEVDKKLSDTSGIHEFIRESGREPEYRCLMTAFTHVVMEALADWMAEADVSPTILDDESIVFRLDFHVEEAPIPSEVEDENDE